MVKPYCEGWIHVPAAEIFVDNRLSTWRFDVVWKDDWQSVSRLPGQFNGVEEVDWKFVGTETTDTGSDYFGLGYNCHG